MEIYLIRHGQTDCNLNHIAQGDIDNHLNEKGLTQAKELALKLFPIPFKEIITSNLLRAYETALEIHNLHPKTILQCSLLLKERSLGDDEGKSHEYFSKLNSLSDRNKCPNKGESINDVFYRAQSILNDLIKKYVNESYSIDNTFIENQYNQIKTMSYEEFQSEFNQGLYTYNTSNNLMDGIDTTSMTKIALVSHCVLIKEFLNNILLSKHNKLIDWIKVHNTALFKFTIFCSNCKGKCIYKSTNDHIPSMSIDIINDYTHLTNNTMTK